MSRCNLLSVDADSEVYGGMWWALRLVEHRPSHRIYPHADALHFEQLSPAFRVSGSWPMVFRQKKEKWGSSAGTPKRTIHRLSIQQKSSSGSASTMMATLPSSMASESLAAVLLIELLPPASQRRPLRRSWPLPFHYPRSSWLLPAGRSSRSGSRLKLFPWSRDATIRRMSPLLVAAASRSGAPVGPPYTTRSSLLVSRTTAQEKLWVKHPLDPLHTQFVGKLLSGVAK